MKLNVISLIGDMRRVLFILLISGSFWLSYYLFFQPYEFQVKFRAKTTAGDVIETIRIWNRSLPNSHIVAVDSFQLLEQNVSVGEIDYSYKWKFEPVNDSILKVNVQISEEGRSLLNKLLVPFSQQPIETDAEALVNQFHQVLMKHLEITKVKIIGEGRLDSVFCVCRRLETAQIEKANGMMKDYPALTGFIADFGLEPVGPPIVKVTDWSHDSGRLVFKFCFPIANSETLPEVRGFSYEWDVPKRVLSAEYFGNYITSDRAWYELIGYARRMGYEITGLPVEYFHNNPNLGINESQWKADVHMPIK